MWNTSPTISIRKDTALDKRECVTVIELLSVSWDKPIDAATLKIRAAGYWEYIHDLPVSAVTKVIKDMAIAQRKWAPKPGELRVACIAMMQDEILPISAEEAWSDLLARSQAIHDGRPVATRAHPVLAATMKKLGEKAITLHTNGDRTMFMKLYEVEREHYMIEEYSLNS